MDAIIAPALGLGVILFAYLYYRERDARAALEDTLKALQELEAYLAQVKAIADAVTEVKAKPTEDTKPPGKAVH